MRTPTDVFGLCGNVIDSQFHVLEVVGEGGFSVVYKGQHLGLREPIAIKCLKLGKTRDPAVIASFTQRFFDESRISYRLSQGNLNIVRSITTGSTLSPATGLTVPYMVLEWLEGLSLTADYRARRQQKLTGRSLREVIDLFEPTASALAYAHSQGIAHRDVKPGNLFLAQTADGVKLKVLDFGMAKVLDVAAVGFEGAATIGSMMVISPQYSAPEQFEPKYGAVGAWTDVYSLAIVLVEALTDRRARPSESFAELLISVGDARKAPTPRALGAQVSDEVEGVFAAAMSVDPQRRPRDVAELWSRLKAAADAPSFDEPTRQDLVVPDLQRTAAMPVVSSPGLAFGSTIPLSQAAPQTSAKGTMLMPQGAQMQQVEAARAMALAHARQPAQQQAAAPAQQYAPPATQLVIEPPPRKGSSSLFFILVGLLVLSALGGGGYFAYLKHKATSVQHGSDIAR